MSQPSPADDNAFRSATPPATPSVERARRKLVAAIVDLEEQDSIPARHVGRLQEFDIGHIFDHAARIAGREIDVLNPGVGGIGRIELPRDSAGQTLISASVAERLAAEGGLGFGDLDMRDPRVRRRYHGGERRHADPNASSQPIIILSR